jgi:hypothetical protein
LRFQHGVRRPRTCGAYRFRFEATFLPNQPGEKFDKQIIGHAAAARRLANAGFVVWLQD